MTPSRNPADPERRRRLRDSVLEGGRAPVGEGEAASGPLTVVGGRVLDASPHLVVLVDSSGAEVRLPMSGTTTVWYGGRSGIGALQPGRAVIVRMTPDGLEADRIWVDISRVTGKLVRCGRNVVEVDLGPHRGWTQVMIPPETMGRVLVRHPRLEPGYLFDVIARDSADGPLAVRPATSQPGYRADDPPAPPPGTVASVPAQIHGTVTWFGDAARAEGGAARGAAYPALDPEGDAGGCPGAVTGCAALPYLSLGSGLNIRNECSGRNGRVVVVECGCNAARFCDRCVECGTSQRGRIAELSAVSFVELGGDLDTGCFNAILSVG